MVMVLDGDSDTGQGFIRIGIGHHAMDAIEGFFHEGEHAVVVVVPEIGQLTGTRGLG